METSRISLDVPKTWLKAIKQAALDDDCKSIQDFLRNMLMESAKVERAAIKADVILEPMDQTWGGKREAK